MLALLVLTVMSWKGSQVAYYRNCADARLWGAAQIHRGEAGFREELDDDSDGIAFEPYLGR
jgi:hypothetical protein